MTAVPRSAAIRVHAFEFGNSADHDEAGGRSRFRDLRMTADFPLCAVRRARLGGLDVRRADLWRLLDPAATDGAVLVWPSSPAQETVLFARDNGQPEQSRPMRVISLIRVA